MNNYKEKISFVSPEGPKTWANNILIFVGNSQYRWDPVIIDRIWIGFQAKMENEITTSGDKIFGENVSTLIVAIKLIKIKIKASKVLKPSNESSCLQNFGD